MVFGASQADKRRIQATRSKRKTALPGAWKSAASGLGWSQTCSTMGMICFGFGEGDLGRSGLDGRGRLAAPRAADEQAAAVHGEAEQGRRLEAGVSLSGGGIDARIRIWHGDQYWPAPGTASGWLRFAGAGAPVYASGGLASSALVVLHDPRAGSRQGGRGRVGSQRKQCHGRQWPPPYQGTNGWLYVLTPDKPGCTFSPAMRGVLLLCSNASGAGFTADCADGAAETRPPPKLTSAPSADSQGESWSGHYRRCGRLTPPADLPRLLPPRSS